MKTLHLTILAVIGLFLVFAVTFHTVNAFCGGLNPDWPKAPCYALPGLHVTKEQMKSDWAGYYQYKGAQWMEMKQIEMVHYTSNNLLKAWTCVNQSNYDVWWYYYLNDQAPSIVSSANGPRCNIPPLQQLKVGETIGEVECGYDQYLLVNNETGKPACVNLSSISKILERGWSHLATYLDKTTQHSTLISTVSITEQDLPSCQSCEGKSENLTVTIGTNNTVRWVNNTPFPISFFTPPDNADIAFSNSARFPTSGHIGAMRFPAYLYSGQSFEYTFSKPGKFIWHTTPQLLGWVIVLPKQLQLAAINQTSQVSQGIPSCASKITNQYATAGAPGFFMCPLAAFQARGQIVNYTGFYGVYNYTKFPNTQNFVLEPGHNGTISYEISISSFRSWTNTTYSNEVNITNYVQLMHDANMYDHPGVYVSLYPKSETMSTNDSAIIIITLAASKDASHGTYWVHLPPGVCSGGEAIILTITDCTGKK